MPGSLFDRLLGFVRDHDATMITYRQRPEGWHLALYWFDDEHGLQEFSTDSPELEGAAREFFQRRAPVQIRERARTDAAGPASADDGGPLPML